MTPPSQPSRGGSWLAPIAVGVGALVCYGVTATWALTWFGAGLTIGGDRQQRAAIQHGASWLVGGTLLLAVCVLLVARRVRAKPVQRLPSSPP